MGMDNIAPPIGCGSVEFRVPTIQEVYCSELERDVANLLANLCDANREAEKLKAERDHMRDLVRRMIPAVEEAFAVAREIGESVRGFCAMKDVDASEVDAVLRQWEALIAEAREAIKQD